MCWAYPLQPSKAVWPEADLGVKLLHRSINLTPDGLRFYEGCQQLLIELDSPEIQESQAAPRDDWLSALQLLSGSFVWFRFSKYPKFPEITLDVLLDDRAVELADQGIDVVLRTGQLSDSANLIARQCDLPLGRL